MDTNIVIFTLKAGHDPAQVRVEQRRGQLTVFSCLSLMSKGFIAPLWHFAVGVLNSDAGHFNTT